MPDDVKSIIDAAGFRQQHLNLALFAIDSDGKLLRSLIPYVRPPAFRFDPEAQGRDFHRQLETMLNGLSLPKPTATSRLTLPDIAGNEPVSGLRIYLTFGANRLNHYRTPTVEAIPVSNEIRAALSYPRERRSIEADNLRALLAQLYPPAIMDGHGGCRRIDAKLVLAPAGENKGERFAILKGDVSIELDNQGRTRYDGPLALVIAYGKDNSPRSIQGVGSWRVPKSNPQGQVVETITMTAAIESLASSNDRR